MTPVDATARDEIRDLHDATLFVEAGAGTGKTTALVDRVLSLIGRGRVTIRELAAITFTEAAAGELRTASGTASSGPPSTRFSPRSASGAGCARRRRRRGPLTLHGFAQRILAEHPLAAGPTHFEVVDDVEAAVRFDERWSEFWMRSSPIPSSSPSC